MASESLASIERSDGKSQSQSQTHMGTPFLRNVARRRIRVNPKEKYEVIKAIATALNGKGLPPMDERLKSIVASQVGSLLRGGWPVAEIRQAALDLALSWDERRGHNRLAHLSARLRLLDAEKQTAAHRERMKIEAALLSGATPQNVRQDPSLHPFSPSAEFDTCSACRGPLGVHVPRRVEVV